MSKRKIAPPPERGGLTLSVPLGRGLMVNNDTTIYVTGIRGDEVRLQFLGPILVRRIPNTKDPIAAPIKSNETEQKEQV